MSLPIDDIKMVNTQINIFEIQNVVDHKNVGMTQSFPYFSAKEIDSANIGKRICMEVFNAGYFCSKFICLGIAKLLSGIFSSGKVQDLKPAVEPQNPEIIQEEIEDLKGNLQNMADSNIPLKFQLKHVETILQRVIEIQSQIIDSEEKIDKLDICQGRINYLKDVYESSMPSFISQKLNEIVREICRII